MSLLSQISIVVPIGPGDEHWKELLAQIKVFCPETEVVLSFSELDRETSVPDGIKTCFGPRGRGKQLNRGAREASRKFVWFLHADSKINREAVAALKESLGESPEVLHFFNLSFDDGPTLMWMNSVGLWCRSHFLGIPFGDQGYCLSKKIFQEVGEFDEEASYGEDHLFVWKVRQRGVGIRCVGAWIHTSARKYEKQGWALTTARHLVLTARQAVPEAAKWIKGKIE